MRPSPAFRLIASLPALPRPRFADSSRWPAGLRTSLALLAVAAFVALTWVRAESLARMMPHLLDLGLGVLAGLIGNTLGHWFRLLGAGPATAHTASLALKMAQVVGVPVGYLLLGGHMVLMPVAGACVAAALVVLSRWLGSPAGRFAGVLRRSRQGNSAG
ncbi:hypothetical protein SAMN02745146_3552 [Hymenobacter daecheongensis DSM 21074]|uniref:Uncharacterized protein n=1 Tax=Hymenobacter daecheongensis DSM 21074 TaxID=1121955 RepID=A0A1M6KSJ8_9BACT|nr:hypothetical protein [Hymenobacter daecheongensis]SHJ61967.1 hypothetical protein SAMN02745146_3552 [Hymenobacter daecheongensis DSM 21074]